jgi:hypothetical protein
LAAQQDVLHSERDGDRVFTEDFAEILHELGLGDVGRERLLCCRQQPIRSGLALLQIGDPFSRLREDLRRRRGGGAVGKDGAQQPIWMIGGEHSRGQGAPTIANDDAGFDVETIKDLSKTGGRLVDGNRPKLYREVAVLRVGLFLPANFSVLSFAPVSAFETAKFGA